VSVVTAVTFSTYHAGGWVAVGWGAYLSFMFVVLAASISMLRSPETARSAAAKPVFATT